jgi:hypothetical protein
MQVTMADARGRGCEKDFAWTGIVDRHVFDFEGGFVGAHDGGFDRGHE